MSIHGRVIAYAHGAVSPFTEELDKVIDWSLVPDEAWLQHPDEVDWPEKTLLEVEGLNIMDCEELYGKSVEIIIRKDE